MTLDPRTTTGVQPKGAHQVIALPFPVAYRPVEEADMGFVVKGWLTSYHEGTEALRRVPIHRFKREQRAVVRDAMALGSTIVACDPDDPEKLHGFACGWDDLGVGVAHYVYVVNTRRRCGLARALLHELGIACGRTLTTYSHTTVAGADCARRLRLRHDPFALVRMIYASDSTVRTQPASAGAIGEPDGVLPGRGAAGGTRAGNAA